MPFQSHVALLPLSSGSRTLKTVIVEVVVVVVVVIIIAIFILANRNNASLLPLW